MTSYLFLKRLLICLQLDLFLYLNIDLKEPNSFMWETVACKHRINYGPLCWIATHCEAEMHALISVSLYNFYISFNLLKI